MKILVVDDEPLARSALVRLCERSHDTHVIGEADTGVSAIAAAENLRPDVMLLNIDLPDVTGCDVLRATQGRVGLQGILVAPDSEDAVAAFTAGAIDYLVKPVSPDRFAMSIERARNRCYSEFPSASQYKLLGENQFAPISVRTPGGPHMLLIGERERRMYPLRPEKIDYIESDGNYVSMRIGPTAYISRDSIKRLSAALAAFGFFRIERSLLVNIRAVAYAEQAGRGTFTFTLSSGKRLRSSVTFREAILRVLPLAPLTKHDSSLSA